MRLYIVSLGAGLLVGIIYSLLNVRSPAPPAVALVGLLGILVGEQIVPMAKTCLRARGSLPRGVRRAMWPQSSASCPRHAPSTQSDLIRSGART